MTVTDRKQTRPLVREGAPETTQQLSRQKIISGHKFQSELDTKTDWLADWLSVRRNMTMIMTMTMTFTLT
jgi:hypothetical protein